MRIPRVLSVAPLKHQATTEDSETEPRYSTRPKRGPIEAIPNRATNRDTRYRIPRVLSVAPLKHGDTRSKVAAGRVYSTRPKRGPIEARELRDDFPELIPYSTRPKRGPIEAF